VRPSEQAIEFWEGPVTPEIVRPGTPQWGRYKLHNAANIHHVQQRLKISGKEQRKYKIAWVGGCVLYDTRALKDVGGFNFWHEAPMDHCGEDVLPQLRLMARYGGCGIIPSGVYHLELPTVIRNRHINLPEVLSL
jgi:hypothetical protein